jgi:hypothetical protein
MIRVPNTVAEFEQGPNSFLRCEVFKSDGDSCDFNWSGNQYVCIGTEFKLIAAVWDKKFVGFEQSTHQTSG